MNAVEERENKLLAPYATFSSKSQGREIKEKNDPAELRSCFMKDVHRIIFSNGFKRLKGKTQVFITHNNDHYMNRLTHTFEVAQISRTIARSLFLNEDLTEAIALGHDIGHTPFGHAGEEAINEVLNSITGESFEHEKQSVRRLQVLEHKKHKKGLNLTSEVIDGIINHSGFSNNPSASTLEGQIVMFSDKIAYLPSDMENAITAGLLIDLPKSAKAIGNSKGKIIDALVCNLIKSFNGNKIQLSNDMYEKIVEFRNHMFKKVYFSKPLREEAEEAKLKVKKIFHFLTKNPQFIPEGYEDKNYITNIVDFISSMTDEYALHFFNSLDFLYKEF